MICTQTQLPTTTIIQSLSLKFFLSNLLFIFLCFRSSTINNMRPTKQKFKLVCMKKDLTNNPQNYPPCPVHTSANNKPENLFEHH